jgi:hypothetical protein
MCPGVDSASKKEYEELPGGKDGRCVRVTTYHLHCAGCREDPGVLTSWNPTSLPRLLAGYLYLYLYLAQARVRVKISQAFKYNEESYYLHVTTQ